MRMRNAKTEALKAIHEGTEYHYPASKDMLEWLGDHYYYEDDQRKELIYREKPTYAWAACAKSGTELVKFEDFGQQKVMALSKYEAFYNTTSN